MPACACLFPNVTPRRVACKATLAVLSVLSLSLQVSQMWEIRFCSPSGLCTASAGETVSRFVVRSQLAPGASV